VLLQLLDDGCLTDGQGRTVDFRNTLIIMTSILGSELWLGDRVASVTRDTIVHALQEHFRPEFLNRIDENIIFHSLSRADLIQAVDIQLRHVSTLLAEQGYRMVVSPEARLDLA
jgi:ATP-dependent Clp protease ATP-binding subunit ClpB